MSDQASPVIPVAVVRAEHVESVLELRVPGLTAVACEGLSVLAMESPCDRHVAYWATATVHAAVPEILPLRPTQVRRTTLANRVATDRDRLFDRLRAVSGRCEFALSVQIDDVAPATSPPPPSHTNYLRTRAADLNRNRDAVGRIRTSLEEHLDCAREKADEARFSAATVPGRQSHRPNMVLVDAAFLVRVDRQDPLRILLQTKASELPAAQLLGPAPPYSFAEERRAA